MTYTEILAVIFEVVVLPLIGILSKYLIQWLNAKAEEVKMKTSNELCQKYVDYINDTIDNCVLATTQTYVESLKAEGKFDKEAQETAFNNTLNAILATLGKEAIKYINEVSGDVVAYLTPKIEATVRLQK